MDLIITNADGFHDVARDHTLAILSFSRNEVSRGRIRDGIDRLLNLTDSKEQSERFTDRLAFAFDGYQDDTRELFQIPEVVHYFRALTREWAGWFHFLVKDPEVQQFPLLFALLCDVEVTRIKEGQIATRFVSQSQVSEVETRLSQATAALYQHHGWPRERLMSTLRIAEQRAFGD